MAKTMLMNDNPPSRENYLEYYYHVAVLYQFILCSGVTLALGLLMLWHGRLISRGETSIEMHINSSQRKKYKKKNLVSQISGHENSTCPLALTSGFACRTSVVMKFNVFVLFFLHNDVQDE